MGSLLKKLSSYKKTAKQPDKVCHFLKYTLLPLTVFMYEN